MVFHKKYVLITKNKNYNNKSRVYLNSQIHFYFFHHIAMDTQKQWTSQVNRIISRNSKKEEFKIFTPWRDCFSTLMKSICDAYGLNYEPNAIDSAFHKLSLSPTSHVHIERYFRPLDSLLSTAKLTLKLESDYIVLYVNNPDECDHEFTLKSNPPQCWKCQKYSSNPFFY
jgi:hypothetical protein